MMDILKNNTEIQRNGGGLDFYDNAKPRPGLAAWISIHEVHQPPILLEISII